MVSGALDGYGKSKHVPYGQLGQDITRFVSEDFCPQGFALKILETCIKTTSCGCYSIYNRQEIHGVTKAFRFSHFIRGDKKFESAAYPPGPDPHHSSQPGHLPIQPGHLPIQPGYLANQSGHLLIQDVRTNAAPNGQPIQPCATVISKTRRNKDSAQLKRPPQQDPGQVTRSTSRLTLERAAHVKPITRNRGGSKKKRV